MNIHSTIQQKLGHQDNISRTSQNLEKQSALIKKTGGLKAAHATLERPENCPFVLWEWMCGRPNQDIASLPNPDWAWAGEEPSPKWLTRWAEQELSPR
jgi:hypothetical protein